ncbi:hypothetical protein HanOQP8_Chr03g0122571 [Helianthus annuus]|nr:hypothetical protein HanOQP8_Chr03g0122571 [Helianthus annuus]
MISFFFWVKRVFGVDTGKGHLVFFVDINRMLKFFMIVVMLCVGSSNSFSGVSITALCSFHLLLGGQCGLTMHYFMLFQSLLYS